MDEYRRPVEYPPSRWTNRLSWVLLIVVALLVTLAVLLM